MAYQTFTSSGVAGSRAPKKKPKLVGTVSPVGGGVPQRPNVPPQFAPRAPGANPVPPNYEPQKVQPRAPQPTAAGNTIRADAQQYFTGATNNYRDSVFRAAMALGAPEILTALQNDPTFAGYQFVPDPTSTFGQLGRQETQGLQGIDYGANDRGALNSGFRLTDRNNYSLGVNDQRAGAIRDYQSQLGDYARALAAAQADANAQNQAATQADIDAAAALDPTNQVALDPTAAAINQYYANGITRPNSLWSSPKKKPKKKKK